MLALLLLALAPAPQVPWSAAQPIDVVPGCSFADDPVVVADFNGDGVDDVMSTTGGTSTVKVSLSTPGGGFAQPINPLPLPGKTYRWRMVLKASDLNGDGVLDLLISDIAFTSSGTSRIYLARGIGTGRFLEPELIGEAAGDIGVPHIEDVSGDGIADLCASNLWAQGLGGGAFGPFQTLVAGGTVGKLFAIGDVDGDGLIDLVARFDSPTYSLGVLKGRGSLPFLFLQVIPVFQAPALVDQAILRDLDQDGDLDLVVAGRGGGASGSLSVVRNLGAGNLDPAVAVPSVQLSDDSFFLSHVELADINGDGLDDVVANRTGTPNDLMITIALATGPMTWPTATEVPVGAGPFSLGDVDADGTLDVAFSRLQASSSPFDPYPCAHAVRLGTVDAAGNYALSEPSQIEDKTGHSPVGAIDVDGDGLNDLVLKDTFMNQVVLRRNLGDLRFAASETIFPLDGTFQDPLLGDFNGDGFGDVISLRTAGPAMVARFGSATGGLQPEVTIASLPTIVISRVDVEDLNGDGVDDLFWAGAGTQRRLNYAFGQASGFLAGTQTDGYVFPSPVRLTAGDADSDGDTDIVAFFDSRIMTRAMTASGNFAPWTLLATTSGPNYGIQGEVADGNGDGIPDLFYGLTIQTTSGIKSRVPHWKFGLGGGNFETSELQASTVSLNVSDGRAMADFDLDGTADLLYLVDFNWPSSVSRDYLSNTGGGLFAPGEYASGLAAGVIGRTRAFSDLDADGDLDLLVGTAGGDLFLAVNESVNDLGQRYCSPAVPNATGAPGLIAANGNLFAVRGDLTLEASQLPPNAFGMFITAQVQDLVLNPGGAVGTLCLGGSIGRFSGPGQIRQADASGRFSLTVDLLGIPTPQFGLVAIQPGDTWNFQTWYRDVDFLGTATSNFTDAVEITYR